MPHSLSTQAGKRIAIIGSGISGLTCGHLLSRMHHVTLLEANDYIGGHTATKSVHHKGETHTIDTGFIVFNERTYPNFIRLMAAEGVTFKPTEMSFSVQNMSTGLEYNGHDLNTLFAQRSNFFKPKFYGFIGEILRFNRLAKAMYYASSADVSSSTQLNETLGSMLDAHGFSEYFRHHYILPMVSAIWSASISVSYAFPLQFFLQFFVNHGLLDVFNRPQWYVLEGGSHAYIPKLTAKIADIRLQSPVTHVTRTSDGVRVQSLGQTEEFDEVILACHSDQSLAMLVDATAEEQQVLAAMRYQDNRVVLHTDTVMLPNAKRAWASWNYRLAGEARQDVTDALPSVTYNMNILQGLNSATTFCVTLNPTNAIKKENIIGEYNYAHPVFTKALVAAQSRRAEICGHRHTHFCGAYWYSGFHEDGVRSALDVCARFGCSLDDLGYQPALENDHESHRGDDGEHEFGAGE